MARLILTEAERLKRYELSDLELGRALARIIMRSLEHDKARKTMSEVKRRFEICCRIYGELMQGGWGRERILGHMPYALRCKLDGKTWEPPKAGIWVPHTLVDPLSKR